MLAPWAMDEMKDAQLNDKRLNKRLAEVLSQFGGRPTSSIPAACGGYAETAAAYRFFDNKKTNFDNVLQPHIEATRRRIAEREVVLLLQDTTEVDLTRPAEQVAGAGPLDDGPTVNVVLVREIDPPADDVPVEWMLLTSLPIGDADAVRTVIPYYCVRWMIEVFFRTLKSGCRVEERRFEHLDRFLPCLAVYLIVTWRTLFVCRLGREFPDISCEAVFEPSEWKAVYHVVHQEPPPPDPPTLKEMIRLVAQLGGYVNRPRSDEPGPQTVWLGLQRTHDMALCWETFGPGARKQEVLV